MQFHQNMISGEQIFNCYTDMLDPVQVKAQIAPNILFGNHISRGQAKLFQEKTQRQKNNQDTVNAFRFKSTQRSNFYKGAVCGSQ